MDKTTKKPLANTYILNELCGNCMVIVWLLCGAKVKKY